MRRIKKTIFIFVSTMLLSFVVAACNSSTQTTSSTTPAASSPAASGEKIDFVAVSYAGDAQIPYRKFLADPFEKKHPNVRVRLVPSESEDVVAQIKAAQGASPYEVIPLGEPRQIVAIQEGWLEKTPVENLPNLQEAYPQFVERCKGYGVPETYSLIGLAYNPDRVPEPRAWTDLWKPEYRGQVGLTTTASNLGFSFVVMTAKQFGGSEKNLDPAWAKLKELSPAVVASSPTELAQLFERGEIGVAPLWNNDAAILAGKGLNVKFAQPSPGAIAMVSCMSVIEKAANPELAREFINAVLSAEYQSQAVQKPWFFGPTNRNVKVPADAAEYLPPTAADVEKLVALDWETVAPIRPQVTERFNREFGT